MNWRYWWIFRWIWPRSDVRRYGACCDGKHDDTRAIQRFINAQANTRTRSLAG